MAEPAGSLSGPARGTSPRPGGLPSRLNGGSTYNKSRNGDLSYHPPTINAKPVSSDAWTPPVPATQSRIYNRQNGVGDQYNRGDANIDHDRVELFQGYKLKPGRSGRSFDGPGLENEPAPGGENEEDVEENKQQTRFVKQESVNSTLNALRMAREVEETARNTMLKLGNQSEKLTNIERHLDVAKGHSKLADDRTDELKQLNRSIFRPVITYNKDGKRFAQDEKNGDAYGGGDADGGIRGRFKNQEQQATLETQSSRYQFEATASDDEFEDEIDDNFNEIHCAVERMEAWSLAMNQELGKQIERGDSIGGKACTLGMHVGKPTARLNRIE